MSSSRWPKLWVRLQPFAGQKSRGTINGSGPVSFQIDGLEQLLYDHLAPQLEVEWDPVRGTCSR